MYLLKQLIKVLILLILLAGCVEYNTPTVAPESTTRVVVTEFPTPTQIIRSTIAPEPTVVNNCTLGLPDIDAYQVVVSTVVRVRLEPHLQSRIVDHLQSGEVVTAKCKYEKSDVEVWLLTDDDLWVAQVFNNTLLERVK